MKPFKDYRLTVGGGRPVRIVNHHNKWLNGKVGTLVGKDSFGYYNQKVWLTSEMIAVIVSITNIVPAEVQTTSFADIFAIYWKIFWHNLAIRIQGWLSK